MRSVRPWAAGRRHPSVGNDSACRSMTEVVGAVRRVAGSGHVEEADRLLPDPIDLGRCAATLREFGLDHRS
jgi:hypothetical protein